MTKIVLADNYTAFRPDAAIPAARLDGAINLIGGLVLLPGFVLGAVMFVAQSL